MVSTDFTDTTTWLKELETLLQNAPGTDQELFEAIVNAPFENKLGAASVFLGVVVLLLVNKEDQTIDRIAICNTEIADRTKQGSIKRFEDIRIPVGHPENILAKAIATGEPQEANDWKYLFVPEMTPEHARFNQADGGIAFSCVYPLAARDGGAMIFSYFQPKELVATDYKGFMDSYSKMVDVRLAETAKPSA